MFRFFKKKKINKQLKAINENPELRFLMVFYLNDSVQFEIYRQVMFSNIGVKVKDDAGFSILIKREHEAFKENEFIETTYLDNAVEIVFEEMQYFMVFCEGNIQVLNNHIKELRKFYHYKNESSIKEELSIDFIPDDYWFVEKDLGGVIYPSK